MNWDAVNHADYYRIRWRSANGGKLNAGVETTSTSAVIAVADYGQWVVRLEACNDSGCGKPLAKKFRVEPDPPAVTDVRVTSQPLSDSTYALEEAVRISVTFDEPVVVTGTPRLKIDMDPANWGEKWAGYHSGSGTASLTFAHTVVEPNFSTQGIAVVANSLELNGGTVRSSASQLAADLSHDGLDHNADHKVDWQKARCELVAPSAVDGLGIERGAVVNWEMPAADSTDNACEGSGFVMEARGSPGTFAFAVNGFDMRSLAASNIPAGTYDMSIFANYRGTRSAPRNLKDVTVPSTCAVTLTLTSPAQYEVAGTWTNASNGAYGCEAGGVYVDWKKKSESEWMSSFMVPNVDEKFNETGFRFGDLDPVEYEFRVRTIDARGLTEDEDGNIILRTTIDPSWMRTSSVVTITPSGTFPNGVRVFTTDVFRDSAKKNQRLSTMRALLEWDPPHGKDSVRNYKVRYRYALGDGWDTLYASTSAVEIDVTAELHTTRRSYILEGLDPSRSYYIEVGIPITEGGVTTTHYSNPVLVSLEGNRFKTWWINPDPENLDPSPPVLSESARRIFASINANHANASGACYVNGAEINCPPRTQISIHVARTGTYDLYAMVVMGKDVVNGPFHGLGPTWRFVWPAVGPHQRFRTADRIPPRPASHIPGISTAPNNRGKAQVTWDLPPGVSSVAAYKIRHRERGTETWTTAAVSNATERKHVLEGLTHHTLYEVQVGACVHGCGPNDEYLRWSKSITARGAVEGARAWWALGTPNLNRAINRMFVTVDANRPISQAVCYLTADAGSRAEEFCPSLVSLAVSRADKYLVEATLTTTEIETPATQTDPAVYKKIGPPARRFHNGYDGTGLINSASVSGGDGKIAVSWKGTYTGIGHTFTKGGKTYKVKEHDADLIIYQDASVGGDYWKQVRVDRTNNGYYEITESPTDSSAGLTNGQQYRVEVWPCMATVEIVANLETGALQRCAVTEVTRTIDGVQRQTLASDPGMILGLPSWTMLATPSATATGLPGQVWAPTEQVNSGRDNSPGTNDDTTTVRWGPPLPSSSAPAALYYDLRYRRSGQTDWTGERVWLPEGVVMKCNSISDEFSCDYVGKWASPLLGPVDHDVEIRARNVNGHGPWRATGSPYNPDPAPEETADDPSLFTADSNSPRNLAAESHYGTGISSFRWDAPASGGTVTAYVVQWEEAATGTKKEATLTAAARSYDVGGKWLARWVRVAATTVNGNAYAKALFTPDDPLQVWFGGEVHGPAPKAINNQIFMNVTASELASVKCRMLQGMGNPSVSNNEVANCPPGTLVSLPQPAKTTFPVWAEAVSLADESDIAATHLEFVANGPFPPDAWASGGNGRLRVAWNEPAHNSVQVGAINGYRVEYRSRNADGTWTDWNTDTVKAATDRSHTFTGLVEGTWQVRVRAKTDGDDDNPNNNPDSEVLGTTSTVRTVAVSAANSNLPGAPSGWVVVGSQKLTVSWQRPDTDEGSLVHGYTVRHKVSTAADSAYVETKAYPRPGIASGSVALTGLTGGTAYVVQVRSHNANGDSSWVTIGTTHTPS